MTQEEIRLAESGAKTKHWKRWGPYLSERAWGTVREDYSPYGTAWEFFPHDHARSRAYRWNEDGLAGIILNRWGHAYLSPQPGFFFGTKGQPSPREILRNAPFGRIAFANTDLAGAMDHRYSILEAQRAVGQLFDQVLGA